MKGKTFYLVVFLGALALLAGLVGLIQINRHTPASIVELNADNFTAVVMHSKTPVFVELYDDSDTCAEQADVIKKIAPEFADTVRFARIHMDKEAQLTAMLGVERIQPPIHILMKPSDGIAVVTVDYKDEAALRAFIKKALKATRKSAPAAPAPADDKTDVPEAPADDKTTAPEAPADDSDSHNEVPEAPDSN